MAKVTSSTLPENSQFQIGDLVTIKVTDRGEWVGLVIAANTDLDVESYGVIGFDGRMLIDFYEKLGDLIEEATRKHALKRCPAGFSIELTQEQ